jgi:hypothetical protein
MVTVLDGPMDSSVVSVYACMRVWMCTNLGRPRYVPHHRCECVVYVRLIVTTIMEKEGSLYGCERDGVPSHWPKVGARGVWGREGN